MTPADAPGGLPSELDTADALLGLLRSPGTLGQLGVESISAFPVSAAASPAGVLHAANAPVPSIPVPPAHVHGPAASASHGGDVRAAPLHGLAPGARVEVPEPRVPDAPLPWFAGAPVREPVIERPIAPSGSTQASPRTGGAPSVPSSAPPVPGAPLPWFASDPADAGRPYFLGDAGRRQDSAPAPATRPQGLESLQLRSQFPALNQQVNGCRLVWLDNGATTHKPQRVIDAVSMYYERDNSNIHRSAHALAARSSDAFEKGRRSVARFLGGVDVEEIVFTRGTTESINLVAQAWGRANLKPGDEVLVSWLEHHANIVPWQQACAATGAVLKPIPVDDAGNVDQAAYAKLLGPRTRLVALTHVSNVVGTVLPVEQMAAAAHAVGALVLVDGAQSVAHLPVDLHLLGADFFVFSGHKVFAPTGIGVLWARKAILDAMPPWQGGGNMIVDVTFEKTTYAPPPAKFEAGTPHISGVVGLGVALDWVDELGRPFLAQAEHALLEYAETRLRAIPRVQVLGKPAVRAGVLPFVFEGVAPGDVSRFLDSRGIALRAGHHCAQPAVRRLGFEAVVRPSFAAYNCPDDVDALADALHELAVSR